MNLFSVWLIYLSLWQLLGRGRGRVQLNTDNSPIRPECHFLFHFIRCMFVQWSMQYNTNNNTQILNTGSSCSGIKLNQIQIIQFIYCELIFLQNELIFISTSYSNNVNILFNCRLRLECVILNVLVINIKIIIPIC